MEEFTCQPLSMDHLEGLVDVHYRITTERNLLPLMGRQAVKAFYRWWVENPSVVALVACSGSNVVGHALGPLSPATYRRELNREIWPQVLVGSLRTMMHHPLHILQLLMARRAMLVFGLVSVLQLRPKDWTPDAVPKLHYSTLLSIGVDPSFQGKGVARLLLHSFVNEMKERGVDELRLTVRTENTRAIDFYNKAGWEVFDQAKGGVCYRLLIENAIAVMDRGSAAKGSLE